MIKIEHTKVHTITDHGYSEDKLVDILVADAKLVLVEGKDIRSTDRGCLYKRKSDGEIGIIGELYYRGTSGWNQFSLLKPILISETEKIEVGDWCLHKNKKDIVQFHKEFDSFLYFKILALPEHFSSQQLQMIADGRLKDSDKVLVECYGIPHSPNGNIVATNYQYPFKELISNFEIKHYIKLNRLTIYPVEEKMYTREEVRKLIKEAVYQKENAWRIGELDKWFEQNIK